MKKNRLKFKRNTAFKTAITGLAYIRKLKRKQQELREREIEILRCDVKLLNKLNIAKKKEKAEQAAQKAAT